MGFKLVLVAGLTLALCGLCVCGCKRKETSARPAPHSPEAVLARLQEQVQLFNDALVRRDFRYIHDYTYYFTGLTQALYSKLDDAQKQRLQGSFDQLATLADELDHCSGRAHLEATQSTM